MRANLVPMLTRFSASKIFTNGTRVMSNSTKEPVDNVFSNLTKKKGDKNVNPISISEDKLKNGFKLFGMEEKFNIDRLKLQREMQKLQRNLHPDKFVDKSREIQEKSNVLSSMVNDFYRKLSHPYERGKYLLSLMTGKSMQEIENTLDRLQMDGEFLGRMMELGENIHDPNSERVTLQKLSYELEKELTKLTRDIENDFKSKNFDNIYKNLGKLKFVANNHIAVGDRIGFD